MRAHGVTFNMISSDLAPMSSKINRYNAELVNNPLYNELSSVVLQPLDSATIPHVLSSVVSDIQSRNPQLLP
jgi:hypothetical protein